MYRIRFHGRGGQGIKTAGRILGTAFFREGFEVQDAPLYGAERRGAPMFAYVRAAHAPIFERGIIANPDLVVVADDTLIPVAAAGVVKGATTHTVLLINSPESAAEWKARLNYPGRVLVVEAADGGDAEFIGTTCAGAAARLIGAISRPSLEHAIRHELSGMADAVLAENLRRALGAFDAMEAQAGCVSEGVEPVTAEYERPAWVDLPLEGVGKSAPAIHRPATSVEVRTGLWRSMRPVIDYDRCNRCNWICGTLCPDNAISVRPDGHPEIDYDHCKGCMICVAVCPPHAISAIPEHGAPKPAAAPKPSALQSVEPPRQTGVKP